MSNISPQELSGIINGIGVVIALYFIKKWMNDVKEDIRKVSKDINGIMTKHQACREELPRCYADRSETNESIKTMWSRIDEHSKMIQIIDSKVSNIRNQIPKL